MRSRLTRQYLLKLALEVRERFCPTRSKPGQCEPVSAALVRALKRDGFRDAETVGGIYEDNDRDRNGVSFPAGARGRAARRVGGTFAAAHEWVRVGQWHVDATYDQFPGKAGTPVLIWREGE